MHVGGVFLRDTIPVGAACKSRCDAVQRAKAGVMHSSGLGLTGWGVGLYKMLFYAKGFVHESIILFANILLLAHPIPSLQN